MKNKIAYMFVILFWLITSACLSQDTLCVMITLDEVINFNYYTSEVQERRQHDIFGETSIRVESNEVLCLHFYDNKKRFRDVTTTWDNGDHRHDTFETKDNVFFSPSSDVGINIEISNARKRKKK